MVSTYGWFSYKQDAQAHKLLLDSVWCLLLEGNIPIKRLCQHVTEVQMSACPYALVMTSLSGLLLLRFALFVASWDTSEFLTKVYLYVKVERRTA